MTTKVRTYKGPIIELPNNGIFVFHSNTQGRHGKGNALIARLKHNAIYGQPEGLQGRSYGIITKDLTKKIHPSYPLDYISDAIDNLYECIRNIEGWKDKLFYISYNSLSLNLNGWSHEQIASCYANIDIPENVVFEEEFAKLVLEECKKIKLNEDDKSSKG